MTQLPLPLHWGLSRPGTIRPPPHSMAAYPMVILHS